MLSVPCQRKTRISRLGLILVAVFTCAPAWSQSSVDPGQVSSQVPPKPDLRDGNVYEGAEASDHNFARKLATNIILDQKDIWTSPFHINSSSAKWWIFTGIGTAALLAADHRVSQALPFAGTSAKFGTNTSRIGQWYTVFPVAGAFYGIGALAHNDKLAETGALSLEALADADITVNVLKVIARRQRPGDGDHGGHFEKGGSSFPSGHSTQAWALAAVVADEYGNHKWVPYVSYGYAALVSTSRVLAQAHFTSDVFVGGAIGFFIGRYAVRTQQTHRDHLSSARSKLSSPSVVPHFSPYEKTLTLAWNY